MPLTAIGLIWFSLRQCKKKHKFSETQFFFKLSFPLCQNPERMDVPVPWCVSGLYLQLHYEVLNYTVKREMRTVIEGASIQEKIILQWRDWYESKFEFQEPELWVSSLGSSLLKDTKQTRSRLNFTIKLQVTPTFLLSSKRCPAPSGGRGRQGWALGCDGMSSRTCVTLPSTEHHCSAHNLIIHSPLKGTERHWKALKG